MEKTVRSLESTINSQKEQLSRYEARLKDVVAAYKGLLKEKEALESSLAAVTAVKEPPADTQSTTPQKNAENSRRPSSNEDNLQLQMATLMNSLATLSAEKSRMEASFQADKKQLRIEIGQKDKHIKELQMKIKELDEQHAIELQNMKSNMIVERHDREKEGNDHMIMIRELQKLYADERHLKENLEMQLNDLKAQFSSSGDSEYKLREVSLELKQAKEKLKQYEAKKSNSTHDNSGILQQLQSEMQHLKQQHAIAIKTEQKRAFMAEERNKKLAALHEDRVANLEARLAELSSTVGTYDRLRQQDQENIQKLKEKIVQLATDDNKNVQKEVESKKLDVSAIVEEIMKLKKVLIVENARCDNPIDVNKIFNADTDHTQCLSDYAKLKTEIDDTKTKNRELTQINEEQRRHIKTLQEKVKVLNSNIDEQELELKAHSEKLASTLKQEKAKWKELTNSLENDYRTKLMSLEHQLQKQRDRSLQLLEEKEQEIKALKTSFEIFVPHQNYQSNDGEEDKSRKSSVSHLNSVLNANGATASSHIGENCHMLHYAHELARKDVEIAALRKSKYSAESALRQALQDKVTAQEILNDKIMRLEEQVDRLERCKTREGANLEYLKNVILSFLQTRDAEGKKHMINAIGAVLQFNPSELKAINNLFHKK
uniref:Putative myosin-11 n=1 Tax=Tabanus bromius TaxID=304241 RepID=A0A0K8TTZ7_TABBR